MNMSKKIRINISNHLLINKVLLNKKRSIIIIFFLLLQLTMIISPKRYTGINYYYSYITIKINEAGNYINVFSDYSDNKGGLSDTHDFTKPNEIHINGINQSDVKSKYNLNETKNVIKLIWNINFSMYSIAYLFRDCKKISEIDLSNFDQGTAIYMESMFFNCISLTSINFTNFNTSRIKLMSSLFYNCISLKELDLSNFATNNVESMYNMFGNCISLTSLNLSNFNTSQVSMMDYMFQNCSSLKKLDISNLQVPKLNNTRFMFRYCPLLTSLDLSNFKLARRWSIVADNMFSNCSSLKYIDLAFFGFSSESSSTILSGSSKIRAINLYGAYFPTSTSSSSSTTDKKKIMTKIFEVNTNIIVCGNNSFFSYLGIGPLCEVNISCMDKIFHIYTSYADFFCKTKCLDDLSNNNTCPEFPIDTEEEINNDLYNNSNTNIATSIEHTTNYLVAINSTFINTESIPYTTINNIIPIKCHFSCKTCELEGNDSNHNCLECKDNYIYELNISNYKNCFNSCSSYYMYEYNNTCYDKCPENAISNRYYQCKEILNIINTTENNKTKFVENIKNELLNNINIVDIDKGSDLSLVNDDLLITFTSTINQKNESNKNKTTISLGECEIKLKNKYNISNHDALYIFKIDKTISGMKIPKIEYEVYYPLFNNTTLYQLDLSICSNMKIDLYIPIEINENLDKYNKSSDYYTDLCSRSTSESGTDITLNDRKNEFLDNNMTLCEENCDLKDYNYNDKKAECSCEIKIKLPLIDEIKFDNKQLLNSFIDVKNIANIHLLKCYKELFDLNYLKKNYGFFIFVFINALFYISILLFVFKFFSILKEQINVIIKAKKNNKLKTNNSLNSSKKNKSKSNILETSSKKLKKINKIKNKNKKNNKKDINNKTNKTNKKSKFIKLKSKNFPPKKVKKNKRNNKNKDSEKIVRFHTLDIKNNTNTCEPLKFNDLELNSFNYENALLYDKRSFIECYCSLLRINHLLIFSFYCNNKDYNPQIIKIFLFFFFFAVHFTVNALFFNDATMHKIYTDEGSYNFIYQIPQIIYSSIISGILTFIIKYLSLPEQDVITIKNEKENNNLDIMARKTLDKIKIKFIFFCIFTFVILSVFTFYISCFCSVYVNTQAHLIKDSLISFFLSFVYPLVYFILACTLRLCSLNSKNKYKKCLYKISQFIQDL